MAGVLIAFHLLWVLQQLLLSHTLLRGISAIFNIIRRMMITRKKLENTEKSIFKKFIVLYVYFAYMPVCVYTMCVPGPTETRGGH